jgi:hypothetical protein
MIKPAAATRSPVVEREMPHPPQNPVARLRGDHAAMV